MGITNQRQWEERISSTMVREQWGDLEMMETRESDKACHKCIAEWRRPVWSNLGLWNVIHVDVGDG